MSACRVVGAVVGCVSAGLVEVGLVVAGWVADGPAGVGSLGLFFRTIPTTALAIARIRTVHISGCFFGLTDIGFLSIAAISSKPSGTGEEDQAAEIRRLKKELTRVTEERDILKKATAYFAKDAK